MPQISNSGADHEPPADVPPDPFSGTERNPYGWLLLIEGDFSPGDLLPTEAIRGAWAVDVNGSPLFRCPKWPECIAKGHGEKLWLTHRREVATALMLRPGGV